MSKTISLINNFRILNNPLSLNILDYLVANKMDVHKRRYFLIKQKFNSCMIYYTLRFLVKSHLVLKHQRNTHYCYYEITGGGINFLNLTKKYIKLIENEFDIQDQIQEKK